MRGQIYNIEDKSFFAFGGAGSHDISAGILDPDASDYKKKKKMLDKNPFALYRINHVSWWEIKQTVDYKQWFFGHMHVNQNFYWERAACIYEQLVRIL